jgi:dTDP-4-dehydrorhamnose reductase
VASAEKVAVTRWLVTGAGGQLGTDVVEILAAYRADVVACDHAALDVTDPDAVDGVLLGAAPDVVVNCAAYTDVDGAETDEGAARRLNAVAPGLLAQWCTRHHTRLIHVSTDYVFAGDADTPYAEDAPTDPRSAYGRTKAAGERAVTGAGGDCHVVRTAWVYGAQGRNFVKTIARLARDPERETLDVVDDQLGSPTWSLHLARALVALGAADVRPGIWHCTGAGQATWCGLARAVLAEMGLDPARVHATTSAAFQRPAPRPSYSVLSDARWQAAGLPTMTHWRDALHEAFLAVGEELVGR